MRSLMYDDADTIRNNLTYLSDVTHDELLTAVIGLCKEMMIIEQQVESILSKLERDKNDNK
jgi:hypothetical protein